LCRDFKCTSTFSETAFSDTDRQPEAGFDDVLYNLFFSVTVTASEVYDLVA